MESSPGAPTATDAAAALREAESARTRLAHGIVTPPWFFAVVAGVQLAWFRRLNGVWVGGFASRVVLGTGTVASASYGAALAAASWAAYDGVWWLVALCSIAGGAAYALGGRRWLGAYRAQPAVHGHGESALRLALLMLPVITGLVLLLTNA